LGRLTVAIALVQRQLDWQRAASAGGDMASSAATAALTGVRLTVEALLRNLRELDYPAVPGLIRNEPGLESRLARLLSVSGTLPPILPLFWRSVGGISLVDLDGYEHVAFWDSLDMPGRAEFCDGVHIDACNPGWLDSAIEDFASQDQDPDSTSRVLALSPDGYHKDNISGGDAYGIDIHGGWLAPLEYFSWTGPQRPTSAPNGPCDLLSYLRTSLLECAGFPAFYGLDAFEPIRQRLLRGVPVF
jgi:hypothetical protein